MLTGAKIRMRFLLLACIAGLMAALASSEQGNGGKIYFWEGKLSVGTGLQIRLVLNLTIAADGGLAATCDSPDQGGKGMKVDSVTLNKEKLEFEMKALDAKFDGNLDETGSVAIGE